MDHVSQRTEPRDEAILVNACHPGVSLSKLMNVGVTQKDARRTTSCNGLIEIEDVGCHLPIGPCHALCR